MTFFIVFENKVLLVQTKSPRFTAVVIRVMPGTTQICKEERQNVDWSKRKKNNYIELEGVSKLYI